MVIKPLSKGSVIPAEEKDTAKILESLPDNWMCICGNKDTYFSFIKNNKKIRGTQIDFVIINEYGIFFLEVKNVSIIKSDHNNLVFQTQNKEEYDPLYRAIEYPNLAKNWLLDKLRGSKIANHLHKKSDLKFGIWGTVVISNDNYRIISPQKELKLKDIIHNKQHTIIHRKELKRNFFKQYMLQKKAPHHDKLSQDDIFLLFHILTNQTIDADSVLTPDTKRTYQMLKYIEKYTAIGDHNKNTKSNNIVSTIKEEKEELQSKLAQLQANCDILREEHNKELERLQDQHKVIEELEKEIKLYKEQNETLSIQNITRDRIITAGQRMIKRLLLRESEIISKKEETEKEKENILEKTVSTRKKNKILVFTNIILIPAVIILSILFVNELTKKPPEPIDIFLDSYYTIKDDFVKDDYQGLIKNYKSQEHSLDFLSSDNITEFNYYLGYSYFVTAELGTSTKKKGADILLYLNMDKLDTSSILDIYPELYKYLVAELKHNEAGELLGKLDQITDKRENELMQTDKGIFLLLEMKKFFIDSVRILNDNSVILNHILSGIDKQFILGNYIDDIHILIETKITELKAYLKNGEYINEKSMEILNIYKKLYKYIIEIEELKLEAYETAELRFTNLKIIIKTEIGRIYSLNKYDNEKAIIELDEAHKMYNKIRKYTRNDISAITNYITMFMLLGKSYESFGDICSAIETYWSSFELSEKFDQNPYFASNYEQIKIKLNELKMKLESSEEDCSFDLEKIPQF